MTRTSLALTAATIVIAATALSRAQSTNDALDPVRVAPDTHKVAFENAFVRVLEVHIPPGSIERRHRHPHGLSVYFTDWAAKVTVDGKEPQVNQRKTGTFAWSDAVIHTVQNVGKTEGHVLRIELKYQKLSHEPGRRLITMITKITKITKEGVYVHEIASRHGPQRTGGV